VARRHPLNLRSGEIKLEFSASAARPARARALCGVPSRAPLLLPKPFNSSPVLGSMSASLRQLRKGIPRDRWGLTYHAACPSPRRRLPPWRGPWRETAAESVLTLLPCSPDSGWHEEMKLGRGGCSETRARSNFEGASLVHLLRWFGTCNHNRTYAAHRHVLG
jgi:hypothetical protein